MITSHGSPRILYVRLGRHDAALTDAAVTLAQPSHRVFGLPRRLRLRAVLAGGIPNTSTRRCDCSTVPCKPALDSIWSTTTLISTRSAPIRGSVGLSPRHVPPRPFAPDIEKCGGFPLTLRRRRGFEA